MLSPAAYGDDKFVQVQGYRLHYVEAGAGHPVILIPGSYSTYRAWDRLVPRLAPHYRLLALDYLGAGDSDKPRRGFRYTVQEQAGLVAGLIERLGLDRPYLIGGSYGGAIVLYLAARYPELVGKVVSIEGGMVKPRELPGSPLERLLKYPVVGDLFIGLVRTGLLNRALMRLVAGAWYPHMTPDDQAELLEQLRYNARSASRVPWYWISISHRTCEDFEEAARANRTPTLYLYGTASDFMEMLVEENVQFLRAYRPDARAVGIEGGAHDLAFQRPQEVAALILDFLGGD